MGNLKHKLGLWNIQVTSSLGLLLVLVLGEHMIPTAAIFQTLTIDNCYEQTALQGMTASVVTCPHECPFASICVKDDEVQCVEKDSCGFWDSRREAYNGTAEVTGQFCMDCRVTGCEKCSSSNVCSLCRAGLILEDGTCHSDTTVWIILCVAIAVLVAWVFIDLGIQACRPTRNQQALQAGLRHRSRCHMRDHSLVGRPLVGFVGSSLHTTPIGGPGMTLFFNWFILQGVVCIWLALTCTVFNLWSKWSSPPSREDLCIFMVKDESFESGFRTTANFPTPSQDPILSWWTGLSYVGATALSAAFLIKQRALWCKLWESSETEPLLQHYALVAQGFPADATDHEELIKYWQAVLQHCGLSAEDSIVEVSVAYDFSDCKDDIVSLIDVHFRDQSMRRVYKGQQLEDIERDVVAIATDQITPNVPAYELVKPCAGTFWTQFLAWVLLGADMHFFGRRIPGYTPAVSSPEPGKAAQLLEGLKGTGTVVVVLQQADVKNSLIEKCQPCVPVPFQDHRISVQVVPEEPDGVYWGNLGKSAETRWKRMLIIMVLTVLMAAIWIGLFYFWADFALLTMGDSATFSHLALYIISVSTIIGNALLALFAVQICDYYGFQFKSISDRSYLKFIVLANVCMVNAADYVVVCYQSLMGLSPNLPRQFMYDYGLRLCLDELKTMLIPMYVLLPYIGEPICSVLLPYWIGIFRVKGDRRITPQHAERLLMAAEIDVINTPFSDMIAITTQFMVVFMAPSDIHAQLFGWLLFQSCVTYFQARLRITRWQTATTIGTDELHRQESHLWAIPLGLLAANFGSHATPDLGPNFKTAMLCVFFFGHVGLHAAFVRFVVPRTAKFTTLPTKTYKEALACTKGATYRNTNPIEVLKSQLSNAESTVEGQQTATPLVHFEVGREDLQPGAEKKYFDVHETQWSLNWAMDEIETACRQVRGFLHRRFPDTVMAPTRSISSETHSSG